MTPIKLLFSVTEGSSLVWLTVVVGSFLLTDVVVFLFIVKTFTLNPGREVRAVKKIVRHFLFRRLINQTARVMKWEIFFVTCLRYFFRHKKSSPDKSDEL
jgi:hypothetical protein